MYRLWCMCVKMSEKDYYYMLKKAFQLLWLDIKRLRYGIVAAICYWIVIRFVFHNGCPFVVLTGFPCPACGLTRAALHLMKGEWTAALKMNVAIYPIVILSVIAVIRRYFMQKSVKYLLKYVIVLLVLMLVYYAYRMVAFFPAEPPMTYYYNNLLRFIVKYLEI